MPSKNHVLHTWFSEFHKIGGWDNPVFLKWRSLQKSLWLHISACKTSDPRGAGSDLLKWFFNLVMKRIKSRIKKTDAWCALPGEFLHGTSCYSLWILFLYSYYCWHKLIRECKIWKEVILFFILCGFLCLYWLMKANGTSWVWENIKDAVV